MLESVIERYLSVPAVLYPDRYRKAVRSLKKQYDSKGWLSEAQVSLLTDAYSSLIMTREARKTRRFFKK